MAESRNQRAGRGSTERVHVTNEVPINDGGNVISVDDGAGSLTVDGNVGTWEVQPSGSYDLAKGDGIDANNSSTATLGIAGVFTGTSTDISRYRSIAVNVYSNVASATDGLNIQQSSDGTNWDHSDVFTIPSGGAKVFTIAPHCQYMRIVYTNGGTGQLSFRLQTILRAGEMTPSSHRVQDSISDDDDAQLVKAVITGQANGTFQNVKTTTDGYLSISDNSSGLSIAEGNVTGATFVHKFGEAPDFDYGDGEVTIWDAADDSLASNLFTYGYETSATITILTSSNAGDAQDIEIQGLDSSWNLSTQTATLNGQTDVTLSTALIRVFRMKNVDSTDLAGDVYLRLTGSGQTAGVPTNGQDIMAMIQNGNNQTLMAVYTIPNGKTGYLRAWFAAIAGGSRSSNYKIRLKARPTGEVFQIKHVAALADAGTSHIQHEYVEPEVFAAKTDIELTAEPMEAGVVAADISGGFDIVLIDD